MRKGSGVSQLGTFIRITGQLLKDPRWAPMPSESDLIGLGWSLGICMFLKLTR